MERNERAGPAGAVQPSADVAFLLLHARASRYAGRLLGPRVRHALEWVTILNALSIIALLIVMHVQVVGKPGCGAVMFGGKVSADFDLLDIRVVGPWSEIADRLRAEYFPPRATEPRKVTEASAAAAAAATAAAAASLTCEGRRGMAPPARPPRWGGLFRRGVPDGGETCTADPATVTTPAPPPPPPPAPETRWPVVGAATRAAAAALARLEAVLADRETALASLPLGLGGLLAPFQEEAYLYASEKAYLMLPPGRRARHAVVAANVTLLSGADCFGGPLHRVLLGHVVGHDTAVANAVLMARRGGWLYSTRSRKLYNLNLGPGGGLGGGAADEGGTSGAFGLGGLAGLAGAAAKPPASDGRGGLTWAGVEAWVAARLSSLAMSLFVFCATTQAVSWTLRETQTRMYKFTLALRHHARRGLPTFGLVASHVVESLVFVPIMIGILFFLFEFFGDQLLAFAVLIAVWLCELFTMISVRTRTSVAFFPWFVATYFLAFHVYFFSFAHGYTYLAFAATVACLLHAVLYFWNRCEVPALEALRRAAVESTAVSTGDGAGDGGEGDARVVSPGSGGDAGGGSTGNGSGGDHPYPPPYRGSGEMRPGSTRPGGSGATAPTTAGGRMSGRSPPLSPLFPPLRSPGGVRSPLRGLALALPDDPSSENPHL